MGQVRNESIKLTIKTGCSRINTGASSYKNRSNWIGQSSQRRRSHLAATVTALAKGKARADARPVDIEPTAPAENMREVKARRYAQSSENSAKPASSRLCTGRCCGVNCFAIKHNGLLHKVRPVTALKLRLVSTPLRLRFAPFGFAQPPLCLAPLALRVWPVAQLACSNKPHAGQPWCVWSRQAVTTGILVRRFARYHEWKARPPRAVCCAGLQPLRVFPPRTRRQALPKVKQPGANSQSPTACTALRAVLCPGYNPIPLYWRGCSTVPSQ